MLKSREKNGFTVKEIDSCRKGKEFYIRSDEEINTKGRERDTAREKGGWENVNLVVVTSERRMHKN